MDRFEFNNNHILDKSDKKELTFKEASLLLNQLQSKNIEYRNGIERIKEGLIDLDIQLGELSWLVDDSENDIVKIREKSRQLSSTITRIMYPQTEDRDDWWY